MTNNNMICKKQMHAAVKIIDSIELENMKINYTWINEVSKTDKFADWKQIFNLEFTHFTLWCLNTLNDSTKLCLIERDLFFIKYVLKHIFNDLRFIVINSLWNHISLAWLLMQLIMTCMHIKSILDMYSLYFM